jgi:hypothetical protein
VCGAACHGGSAEGVLQYAAERFDVLEFLVKQDRV